mgnify:CR=1 FL=1
MKYNIREIEEKDNKEVENVIRACLIEFGANHEGTAWADPNLGRFSEIYNTDGITLQKWLIGAGTITDGQAGDFDGNQKLKTYVNYKKCIVYLKQEVQVYLTN